ncbi:MAG TPA: 50S ribosomal protein L25 [Elusimicrobia bacterium]|nr:MAG: hypothetical protein A2278_06670 [Elusimicrobia bacterium RIFOXYA12_FULL_49_49]OGS10098.1 MAG: hypothetical protein A2204_06945 [Elusimicrobia bacterium RIFOXYA1_FULL_47_7]OGS16271.1 MAG: hypothetical protein A2251_01515 [Elusimicrobia bacterium RIFOXYA2_FULL_47_53]OGS26186.1 MAG: hypothetical protein A2339_02580 [Elusimicrobia bacterium RIFOXYB12_FULL_50_12]OGS31426.1 MAG: hypothetical protein A2323_09805 [Elusimicrobia bacterium RIFOXYB2_FULL_46_23]HBU70032.1 50S ribosomal protein L2
MKEIAIAAEKRDVTTKHNLKALRESGKIPAVFYAEGEQPVSIFVDTKNFEKLLGGGMGSNALINLNIAGQNKMVIIKEIQNHIITEKPIHIDFQGVSLKKKIEVSVHLKIEGEAPGVKIGGGVLEHILREVKVRCLPTDIPQHIVVDVSKLDINHAIAVRDLPITEGLEFISDPASIIVNIVAPTELEETPVAAAAAAATAEPEVIAKGKKDKEEGAAPAAGADKKAAPAAGAEQKK